MPGAKPEKGREGGFYTLSRKLHDWPVGQKFSVRPRDAMADLVAWAAFANGQSMNGVTLNRGEVVISERYCAMAWGWSRNRVRRFLKWLIERGTLREICGTSNGTTHDTTHGTTYVLVKYDTWQMGGTMSDTTYDTTRGPKEEVIKETKKNTSYREEVETLVSFYLQTHTNRRVVDKKARDKIKQRLADGFTVEQLQQAITGNALDPWHKEKGKHGMEYVMRDADHVNDFIAANDRMGGTEPMSEFGSETFWEPPK